MPNKGEVSTHVWGCTWGAKKPWHTSRGPTALVGPLPRDVCIEARHQPSPSSFGFVIFSGSSLTLSSLKTLRKHHSSSSFVQIFIRLSDRVRLAYGGS